MIPGLHTIEPLLPSAADLAALGLPSDPQVVGLFEGYGGLTMGALASLGGGTLAAYAEVNPDAIRILQREYPGVPNLGDVSLIDWATWEGRVHVMLGGFPCQDVSHAGLGAGLAHGTRSGLWYEFARAIAATRPALVIIENVRGLRSAPAGLKEDPHAADDWDPDTDRWAGAGDVEPDPWSLGDGDDGPILRALGAVLGDLAELGYRATWDSVRASDVGAPHQRERVFIVAIPEGP